MLCKECNCIIELDKENYLNGWLCPSCAKEAYEKIKNCDHEWSSGHGYDVEDYGFPLVCKKCGVCQ